MGVKLLGKIKIYELAKELNLTSKELMEKVKEMGIEVKTHMSSIEEDIAKKVRKILKKGKQS